MTVTRLPSFWRDLEAIVEYYCDANEESRAIRFAKAVDKTIEFIERFPTSVTRGIRPTLNWRQCDFGL